MRLRCFFCGKSVSNEVPDDTIVRACLECPECIEAHGEIIKKLASPAKAMACQPDGGALETTNTVQSFAEQHNPADAVNVRLAPRTAKPSAKDAK
jgi:hypothetical protein